MARSSGEYAALGVCGRCGARPRTSGYASCQWCRDKGRELRASRRAAGLCTKCGELAMPGGAECSKHRDIRIARNKKIIPEWTHARRLLVIDKLGGKCACCGENEPEFLEIDHVNGGGGGHRKDVGGYQRLYKEILDGRCHHELRLLCGNCHLVISRLGYCVHERHMQHG